MNNCCRTFQSYRIIRVLLLRFGTSPCYCVSKGTEVRRDIREERAVRNQFCLARAQRCVWYRNCEDSVEMSHDVLTHAAVNCSCFVKCHCMTNLILTIYVMRWLYLNDSSDLNVPLRSTEIIFF